MGQKFFRPTNYVQDMEYFTETEVGLNHPDVPSFIRIRDNGDIEIMAEEGLGIIIRPATRSVIINADNIKLMTKDGTGGLRWNNLSFNGSATAFNEPTFIQMIQDELHNTYAGIGHYLFPSEPQTDADGNTTTPNVIPNAFVIDPETSEQVTWSQYYSKYRRNPPPGSIRFG